jgi:hypothetical protein
MRVKLGDLRSIYARYPKRSNQVSKLRVKLVVVKTPHLDRQITAMMPQ